MSVRHVSVDYGLRSQFNEITQQLRELAAAERETDGRCRKPLAFWAVGSDRRLPYALMDRAVQQIIETRFDDLAATPGIGHKKMVALVMLLHRVFADKTPEVVEAPVIKDIVRSSQFDPSQVSEVDWEQWRQTVRRHGFSGELLGRCVSSLQSIPTIVWRKPLGDYLDLTVDQLRRLRAHGDKRVSAVLEVFHNIHRVLGQSQPTTRLHISLRPAFVPPLEQWICSILDSRDPPSLQELRQRLVLPLLNQIELDAGETVHQLATGRLGIESFPEAVCDQARELGVTRARVYQLLDTCYDLMQVRWPEGRWLLQLLGQLVADRSYDEEAAQLLETLGKLLYPLRVRERVQEPAIA